VKRLEVNVVPGYIALPGTMSTYNSSTGSHHGNVEDEDTRQQMTLMSPSGRIRQHCSQCVGV